MHVIIKLKNGEEVMGKMSITAEDSILLEGALIIRYGYNDQGVSSMYFEKYSLFTAGFDVTFMNRSIDHVFRDPLKFTIHYYEKTLNNMQQRYKGLLRKTKFVQEPSESPESDSVQELFEHMFNMDKKKVH